MDQDLKGKTTIITGGGTGIGRGIALRLAELGVRVVICGRRLDRLEAALEVIQSAGGQGLLVQADISEVDDARRVIQAALEAYGRIDILVNNAGIDGGDHLHEMAPEAWDRVMKVNMRGPFLMTRFALPIMREQKYGQIINISSESGIEYYHADGAYGLSKHSLNAFGEYVQRENQEHGIRVNTICPGMVVTEMSKNSAGLDHSKCLYPEDIADLAAWLLTRRTNIKIGRPMLYVDKVLLRSRKTVLYSAGAKRPRPAYFTGRNQDRGGGGAVPAGPDETRSTGKNGKMPGSPSAAAVRRSKNGSGEW